MLLLIHRNAKKVLKVIQDGEDIIFDGSECSEVLWNLANKYPEEIIGWCDEAYYKDLALRKWRQLFHHDLIMGSYAISNNFLSDKLGYIDQMPFVNINRGVLYGTWQMSSDVGGIKGEVLQRFQPLLKKIKNFPYLLNSIGKLGQQNGLCCYSLPELIRVEINKETTGKASTKELFRFVFQHYNTWWTTILLMCFLIFDKRLPVWPYISSHFNRKLFQRQIDLSAFEVNSRKERPKTAGIDVVIPTLGREKYLFDVLKDLSQQTHLPQKVIIVEQNPIKGAATTLNFLQKEEWPFVVEHQLIYRTGVCNARNIGISKAEAEWVFLADDDIRFKPELLASALNKLTQYGLNSITMSCLEKGGMKIFRSPKQWGTFGAGSSLVKRSCLRRARFLEIYENGYGEDMDFGMQLRNIGCDVFYHPELELQHLKAPTGGFRTEVEKPWNLEKIKPKPAPNLFCLYLLRFTHYQLKGYRISLYLRYYFVQGIKNPITYIRTMNKRWEESSKWAKKLIKNQL